MENSILSELVERYPALNKISSDIHRAFLCMEKSVTGDGTVFICGNGGSLADAEHIAGELLKSFRKKRAISDNIYNRLSAMGETGLLLRDKLEGAIPAIVLSSHPAFVSAYGNDKDALAAYAQQLYALGKSKDVLVAISTSGNAVNCIYAATVARAIGMKVVVMTGSDGGGLKELADVSIRVPESETYKIQELHLPIYHCLCAMLEAAVFPQGE